MVLSQACVGVHAAVVRNWTFQRAPLCLAQGNKTPPLHQLLSALWSTVQAVWALASKTTEKITCIICKMFHFLLLYILGSEKYIFTYELMLRQNSNTLLKCCISTFLVPHMYHTASYSQIHSLMNFRVWKVDNTFSSLSCNFRLGTFFFCLDLPSSFLSLCDSLTLQWFSVCP